MKNNPELRNNVIDYLRGEYPDEYNAGMFTTEIVDAIIDDIVRTSDDEDPLTRLYESDYNNDFVLQFLLDDRTLHN